MKKFRLETAPNGATFVYHNLNPELKIQVVKNKDFEYNELEDVYELFEFKGNIFAFVVVSSELDLNEIEDFSYIRSLLRKGWKWYKTQIYIEKYVKEGETREDERFVLQESKDFGWWVCTDKCNGIVIKFRDKLFNESQKVTTLEDFDITKISISNIAKILREIGEWLTRHHSEKL